MAAVLAVVAALHDARRLTGGSVMTENWVFYPHMAVLTAGLLYQLFIIAQLRVAIREAASSPAVAMDRSRGGRSGYSIALLMTALALAAGARGRASPAAAPAGADGGDALDPPAQAHVQLWTGLAGAAVTPCVVADALIEAMPRAIRILGAARPPQSSVFDRVGWRSPRGRAVRCRGGARGRVSTSDRAALDRGERDLSVRDATSNAGSFPRAILPDFAG